MSWSRYLECSDSGVEWLGSLPVGWEVVPLKAVAEVFPSNVDKHAREGEQQIRLCNYTDVYYNDVIAGDLDLMVATASLDQVRRFSLRAGDTIITKDSESADDIGISAYVPNDLDGVVCGYHLSIIRPKSRLVGAFAKRLFDTSYVKAVLATSANGLTRVGLGQYALDNIDIPLPPVGVQRQVVEFLDRETAKIDALIGKQEQLIATLREDRTATITHAVTKGLDPAVTIEDSGSVWLGPMPSHWHIRRLKDVLKAIDSGTSVNGMDTPAEFPDLGVLKTSCVSSGVFSPEANKTVLPEEAHRVSCPVRAGTVIVNRANTPELVGSAGYVGGVVPNLYLSDLLWAVSVRGIDPRFLHRWTQTPVYRTQVAAWRVGTSASMQKLSKASLRSFAIALPPLSEQRRIVDFLEDRCAKIDALVVKTTAVIERMREYRSALITAAVTGKIDVRQAVA
ncbi:restriction endonuclease subunit S [Rhodococcus aetherivorans]